MNRCLRPSCVLALLFVGALAGASAAAQSGPGLPGLVYDPADLFKELTRIDLPNGSGGNYGQALMHDGYLATVRYSPGGVDFYDVSNPFEPVLVQSITQNMDLSEPHTHAQTTAYGGQHVLLIRGAGGLGGTGFAIWDWTDIFNPNLEVAYDVPGVPGGYATGLFWLFYQAPYVYCGAGSLGLFVVDASDPTSPFVAAQLPTSQTGGFNAVNTLAVGNLLIVTNSDGGPGMARFDISDPINPQLLFATTSTSIPYGLQLNGGQLLVPAVSGPVGGPGGNGGVFEVRDPFSSTFDVVNTLALPSRGGSVVVQDGYAHVAASAAYQKIDISNPAAYSLVGSASNTFSGGDWDWVTPLGNLAFLGDDQGGGGTLVPHRSLPDNTGPRVTMVVPADGATNQALTSRVGITLSDMVELGSIDAGSFAVRPVGGAALAGAYSNQFGIVNFTPDVELLPNTTYEVVVPDDGLRDWAGNGASEEFVSRFSTGSAVTALQVTAAPTAPAQLGAESLFDVASVSGPGPFLYSWNFGDGSPATPFSSAGQAAHTYSAAGHFAVVVTVQSGALIGTDAFLETVHHPLTAARPTHSSTIILDEVAGRVWCVNADNDTVTAIDAETLLKEFEVPVGAHPRTLAAAPDGSIWVVCQDDATIHVLDPNDGALLETIALPYASMPYGIAFRANGSDAYVTLRASGKLARLDPGGRSVSELIRVGPDPKGIAIAADSERIFVTRFISSSRRSPLGYPVNLAARVASQQRLLEPVAEVAELSALTSQLVRRIPLALDEGPDSETSGRGLPNYLSTASISPDGRRLWVPSKKDNIQRGLFREGRSLSFDSTVRTIVSQVDLAGAREDLGARIDFNDRDMAFAVEFSPLGDYAFHVLQGSNAIDVRDTVSGAIVAAVGGTGLAPQGLVLSSDGALLFVHNFMSRTVSVYDAAGVTSSTSFGMALLANVSTVTNELLGAQVLEGKQIFYNALDPRMNEDGYLSCASCHLDGGQDGRTWDFTERGEGLRNTISLRGRRGTGHGNVHWTANFDEIQDFENDMRGAFGGDGFMEAGVFHNVIDPLGPPKQGIDPNLDALSAYVGSLNRFGLSPHRNADGTLTAAAVNGKARFQQLACSQCHFGENFSDSAFGVLHDVGTLRAGSGQARGAAIVGLDTPTLRGLWLTPPYLHDGSARTLRNVLRNRNPGDEHGVTSNLTVLEISELVAYLLQIDDLEPAAQ